MMSQQLLTPGAAHALRSVLWHIKRSRYLHPMPTAADSRAGRIAFTNPDFVLFQIARFLIVGATEMQAVAVGWQVYGITRRALDLGLVRSFNGTASRSILPQLVPDEHFANAVAWNATTFQAATILGPSLGGIL